MKSSWSDSKKYKDSCISAATTDFDNFKKNEDYRHILEGLSPSIGLCYLRLIIQKDKQLFIKYSEKFKENDKYGGTYIYNYGPCGKWSPATLRYIHVMLDMKALFNTLDNLNIVEIGGGYGGHCKNFTRCFQN